MALSSTDLNGNIHALVDLGCKVRIPMKGLLYWKAERLLLDCYRNKWDSLTISFEPLDENKLEDDKNAFQTYAEHLVDDEKHDDIADGDFSETDTYDNDEIDSERIKKRNLKKVDALLYAPVEEAETKLKLANTEWERERAEARLKSELKKFFRREQVCKLLLAEYGEAKIAEELGTTRYKAGTDIKNVFNLLHDGFAKEYGDFRREQRLQTFLNDVRYLIDRHEIISIQKECKNEQKKLISEFDVLLKTPVQQARSNLIKAEDIKRQLEDKWLSHCFAINNARLLDPEEKQKLRTEYLLWLDSNTPSDKEIALRQKLKADEVAKYRMKYLQALQTIKNLEEILSEADKKYVLESEKTFCLLRLLMSDQFSPETDAIALDIAVDELEKHRRAILGFLATQTSGV